MPPIDPNELLKAFRPLLTDKGGIKSVDEVARLAGLMKKYCKKLVSKCTYCNILLATSTELLESFLGQDGWTTINAWLKDAWIARNFSFIGELLKLLDKCPVNLNRLKSNDTPRIVKLLVKCENAQVAGKAKSIVDKWLEIISTEQPKNGDDIKKRKKEKSSNASGEGESEMKPKKIKKIVEENEDEHEKLTKKQRTSESEDNPLSIVVCTKSITTDSTAKPKTVKIKFGKSRGDDLLRDNVKPGQAGKNQAVTATEPKATLAGQSTPQTKSQSTKKSIVESGSFIEQLAKMSESTFKKRKKKKDLPTQSPTSTAPSTFPTSAGSPPTASSSSSPTAADSSPTEVEKTEEDNEDDMKIEVDEMLEMQFLIMSSGPMPPLPLKSKMKSCLRITNNSNSVSSEKRSIRWRDEKIVEVRYFELDENERTNVTRNSSFLDSRNMEIMGERQALLSAKAVNRAQQGERCQTFIPWVLHRLDLPPDLPLVDPGYNSEEKRTMAEKMRLNYAECQMPGNIGGDYGSSGSQMFPHEPDLISGQQVSSVVGALSAVCRQIPIEDTNLQNVHDYSDFSAPKAIEQQPSFDQVQPAMMTPPVVGQQYYRPMVQPTYTGAPVVPQANTVRGPFTPIGGTVGHGGAGGFFMVNSDMNVRPMIMTPEGMRPISVGPNGPAGGEFAYRSGPQPPVRPPGGGPMRPAPPQPPGVARWPTGPTQSHRARPPICRHISQHGSCRFASRCNYYHPPSQSTT